MGATRVSASFPLRVAALPLLLLLAFFLAVLFGDVSIPPATIVRVLLMETHLRSAVGISPVDTAIVWQIRFPRVLAAGVVGASLAVAGLLFQAVLRNPLADPYVIGTAAGAQTGVVLGLLLPFNLAVLGFGQPQVLAFAGALLTVLFVYGLARTGGRTPPITLVLAGFVTSSFLISLTTMLMQLSGKMNQVLGFILGSLSVSNLDQLAISLPIAVLCWVIAFLLAPRLDLMLLGEEGAAHLGVRVEALKLTAIVIASLLTGLAVALAGIVAFAGLVVPHALRLIYGPRHRLLVPASVVAGAAFLIIADLIARVAVAPTEISLGVVTAVIGAPLFLHLLHRSRRDYVL